MTARKPKIELFVNHLLEAVKFVSFAQRGKGDEASSHSIIRYGQIVASSPGMAAGAVIVEDDLDCCPQTERLRMALERCGQEHTVIQRDAYLFVRSGEFSAYVPLCDPAKLAVTIPDAPVAPLGDTFRAALMSTAVLVKETAATVLQSSVQLNPYSCVATNGNVIIEAWHGFDMPPGLLIPKAFADAVIKARKSIKSFGFSKDTFTIHFEDRSWLRTLLYKDKIPDMLAKFAYDQSAVCRSFPTGFFAQVAEIAKWSEDGRVYVDNREISSHPPTKQAVGSSLSFPMPELRQGVSYSISSLKLIAKFAKMFNDQIVKNATVFYGDNLRGVIAHETTQKGE